MCILLFILLFSSFSRLLSEPHKFTKYLKNYDIADCFVSGFRNKRGLLHAKEEKLSNAFDAEVKFKTQERIFHLFLIEDADFKKLKVESYLPDFSTVTERVNIKVFEGIMKHENLSSYVMGYLQDGIFTGTFKFNEQVYFVEPASNFFLNLTSRKVIVYKEDDIVLPDDFDNEEANVTSSASHWVEFRQFEPKYGSMFQQRLQKSANENEDYACVIELVADHTLYNHFKGNTDALTAYLYLHGKSSDMIFRKTDFDNDGKRDRIRIITEKIFIYKSENDPDYPMNMATDLDEFLDKFSFRTQNFCLSICMVYRQSKRHIIGLAWKSSPLKNGPPGGICQKPIRYSMFSDARKSLNTAVVTVHDKKSLILPMAVSMLAVAHEIGHSFGSDHDPMEDLECSPGGNKGYYLMHSKSQGEIIKPLGSSFSPCSKKRMVDVIATRGICLKPYPATCGNGVQEGNEECDCGKEGTCKLIDDCCTPSDTKPPEKGCTFRKSKGAVCSFKENECCLKDCSINKDTQFLCYNDSPTCRTSYCDGESAVCPEAKVASDGYPCKGTSRSCSGGYCNSSVCLDNNLKECICRDPSFECHVCCEKGTHCVTATSLGFLSPSGEQHFALEGTLCNAGRYQCNGGGRCINPRLRQLSSRGTYGFFWWAMGGLAFAILVVLSVLVYFVKQLTMKS